MSDPVGDFGFSRGELIAAIEVFAGYALGVMASFGACRLCIDVG